MLLVSDTPNLWTYSGICMFKSSRAKKSNNNMQIHKSRPRSVFGEKHGLNYRRAKGDPCSPEKVISFPEMRYLGEALKHGYEISGSRVINSKKYIRICHFNEWKTQTNISDSDWFPQMTRFNVMTPPELLFSVLAQQPYLFCVSVAQTDWSPTCFSWL